MGRWDAAKVASAAPDAAALTAARKLATPAPWSATGCSDVLVWGRCQGSGSTPYQTSIDLTGPAYRCNCPSRKFPCKHALALLMLWSDGVVDEGGIDPAAAAWAANRVAKAQPAKPAAKVPDAAGQARRLADRLELMDGGVEDLGRWLGDLVRGGIAEARGRGPEYWDATARRLVDAQVPGLAARVRRLPAAFAAHDWTTAVLDEVGLLWSLVQAWRRRDLLDADAAADLRVEVGWPLPSAEVRASDERHGDWLVLGTRSVLNDRVTEQRTWLVSEADGETFVVLEFAAGGATPPAARRAGTRLRGGLSRYPGSAPRRVVLHEDVVEAGAGVPSSGGTLTAALDAAAAHLAANPWAVRTPVVVDAGIEVGSGRVIDGSGVALPIASGFDPWPLAAVSGGAPTRLFGELDGGALRPLSAVIEDRLVAL